ncbi:MAG: hypothetical protein IH946_09000 [Bacteroidetes bacterium]|nr:hypothetical protein [Bacteroidota bacterium]
MPYSEYLADRIRRIMAEKHVKRAYEKPMMGGLVFMVDEKMCSIKSDVLAKNIYLACNLNGHFSNNYFDIVPGVGYMIKFETDQKRLDILEHLKVYTLIDSFR